MKNVKHELESKEELRRIHSYLVESGLSPVLRYNLPNIEFTKRDIDNDEMWRDRRLVIYERGSQYLVAEASTHVTRAVSDFDYEISKTYNEKMELKLVYLGMHDGSYEALEAEIVKIQSAVRSESSARSSIERSSIDDLLK